MGVAVAVDALSERAAMMSAEESDHQRHHRLYSRLLRPSSLRPRNCHARHSGKCLILCFIHHKNTHASSFPKNSRSRILLLLGLRFNFFCVHSFFLHFLGDQTELDFAFSHLISWNLWVPMGWGNILHTMKPLNSGDSWEHFSNMVSIEPFTLHKWKIREDHSCERRKGPLRRGLFYVRRTPFYIYIFKKYNQL